MLEELILAQKEHRLVWSGTQDNGYFIRYRTFNKAKQLDIVDLLISTSNNTEVLNKLYELARKYGMTKLTATIPVAQEALNQWFQSQGFTKTIGGKFYTNIWKKDVPPIIEEPPVDPEDPTDPEEPPIDPEDPTDPEEPPPPVEIPEAQFKTEVKGDILTKRQPLCRPSNTPEEYFKGRR